MYDETQKQKTIAVNALALRKAIRDEGMLSRSLGPYAWALISPYAWALFLKSLRMGFLD